MADVTKLKKAGRLGAPPAVSEASSNLTAPEVVPAAAPVAVSAPPATAAQYQRRDGRTARRTHRTLPFATRVSPAFDERLRDIAERDNLMLVEVLELALDAYEAQRH
ncbi:hypothetical protein BVER_03363 [Candidatus Burkholderia verschuerenii]|uniref:Uncharacterized protein n=1 Tax=Candidatus Burkholderia verschuerenii TaxID=242163 RepID=A0A0L0MAK1_9BURK|nr:hypothetical protein [Candidatus Burkholderia verschuerenii]KND59398.1 hypothetical protein BVER_03363 [Candidatus Burkholderia verschuerenii]